MKSIYIRLTFGFIILSALLYVALATEDILWTQDLIFSHKLHVQENEIECVDCHEKALESTSGSDELYPKKETCFECHDEEDSECGMCHNNPVDPVIQRRIVEYTTIFSHADHLGRDLQCEKCHFDVVQKESLEQMHLPKMAICMSCHGVPEKIDGCYKCHDKQQSLKPSGHNGLWASNHGIYKDTGIEDCSTCHSENYCIECHEGENLFAESHPPEFILTHSMSFMVREFECFSCHEGNDYCIECHIEVNNIKPASHAMPNWQWPMGESLHEEEGRGNIEYCATCHREDEEYCALCHGDGARFKW